MMRIALLAAVAVTFCAGASPLLAADGAVCGMNPGPGTIWTIGHPDAHVAEFGLADRGGYPAFNQRYGQPVVFTFGKSTLRDWPFVHPAPRDTWAGGRVHTFTIEFQLPQPIATPTYLVIGTAGGHTTERSDVIVNVNGADLPAQQGPAGNIDVVFHPTAPGAARPMIFEIPPSTLRAGDNTLAIRLEKQSWILYDYVALRTEKQPLPIQPPPQRPLAGDVRDHCREIIFAVRQPGTDGHWYANFSYYAADEKKMTYRDGGRLCRLNLDTGELKVLLDDPRGGVRDPQLHYDGRTILFSYRKADSEHYHLYEIDIDGSNLRQLTDGGYDDIEPCYLPNGDIVFVSSRAQRWVNCWLTQVATLYRCDRDGKNIRMLSPNNEHDNTPWVLPDGRVLYTRWEYVDRSQVHYHHLWTMNPDGTGVMTYYGNLTPGVVMIDAKPIPGSTKIASIFSPGHGMREHDGAVAVVDTSLGPDDPAAVRTINPAHDFRDVYALSENLFLVARRTEVLLMDGSGTTRPLFTLPEADVKAGMQVHEPRPIITRPREHVIADNVKLDQPVGHLILADIYDGRNMAGVKRGEIRKLLVLETLPKPINYTGGMDPLTYGGSFTLERVVGTVPVEPDGSAFIELPALRSFFFVALDEHDMSVKRMQSFLNVQPGEVTRCVGCHEQRTKTPVASYGSSLAALKRRPSRIEPIADVPQVFDFPRDIQPILDALCNDCHGYEKTDRGGPRAGRLLLTGDRGPMFSHGYYMMTIAGLFSDGRNQPRSNYAPRTLGSSASRILKMLDGSHYEVKATEHQKRMLRLWIESAAVYPGTYAALGTGMIGGYYENHPTNTDWEWPTTNAGAAVIDTKCQSCHNKPEHLLPRALSDERGVSFWQPKIGDPRLLTSRHIVFNLTRPEQSLMLLAPLSAEAGGWGLCKNREANAPAPVFTSKDDPDYQKLLAMIEAGRANLEKIKRFDMPGFRPHPAYVREMKRYGVLPADLPADAPIDIYKTDEAYWRSQWYKPAQK